MKIAFLSTLDAVLRRGSFAAAAQDVGLTASAVSLQIRELEKYFGQPLFDRSSRTSRPTAFARELSGNIQGALATIEALRDKRSPLVLGRVALGTIRSVQTTTLPATMLELRARYPGLEVRLVQEDSPLLLRDLNAGELDAAVVVRPRAGGSSRLRWRNLARESFVLLAPPNAKGDSVTELLHAYEWIRWDASLTGGRSAASFIHRVAPRARGTLDLVSIEAIVAMVSAGLGVSVVPRLRGPLREAYPVREIGLGRNAPTRLIAFVCRAADADNRRVAAVREAFEHIYAASLSAVHGRLRRRSAGVGTKQKPRASLLCQWHCGSSIGMIMAAMHSAAMRPPRNSGLQHPSFPPPKDGPSARCFCRALFACRTEMAVSRDDSTKARSRGYFGVIPR